MRPTEQIYSHYTAEDFSVWKTLYDRQMPHLRAHACAAYLRALDTVGFCAERIPDFAVLEEVLRPLTGWGIKVVPNISEAREFFGSLAQKRFTATCWLRTMAQLDYIEEPDMFHDVFGHVPMLTDIYICDYLHGLSEIAKKYSTNEEVIEAIARLYWYTIEFGLVQEGEQLKIYGAGILSSIGETVYALSDTPAKVPFDVRKIIETPYIKDSFQKQYFVLKSMQQLKDCLPGLEKHFEKKYGRMTE